MAKTMIPAKGENMRDAISAGTSPKSTLRYGVGKNGIGKFRKNNKNEIVPNSAKIIIVTSFFDCISTTPSSIYIDSNRDEG